MTLLVAGLAIFLGIHSVSIINRAWRDRAVSRWGLYPWQALFSAIAIVGLVLIVWGYGGARQAPVVVYQPPVWLRHVALLLMVFVFPLLLAAYLPGRIRAATRHPMLIATKIWAFAHLLANGMLHDVVLFGALLAWAVIERTSLRWRDGPPVPAAPESRFNDLVAITAGLSLYVWLLFRGHAWLFGVAPLGG